MAVQGTRTDKLVLASEAKLLPISGEALLALNAVGVNDIQGLNDLMLRAGRWVTQANGQRAFVGDLSNIQGISVQVGNELEKVLGLPWIPKTDAIKQTYTESWTSADPLAVAPPIADPTAVGAVKQTWWQQFLEGLRS